MTFLRSWFVSGVMFIAVGAQAVPAFAQTPAIPAPASESKIATWINFGAQGGSGDLSQHLTPIIYDEAATIDVAQTYENGPLVELGGGYLFYDNFGGKFGAALSYSHTSGDGNAVIAAQIPDPLVSDPALFRAASAAANNLKHSEDALHFMLLYRRSATDKIDVTFGIGPTVFWVNQELIPTVTVTEPTRVPPFGTPSLTPVVVKGKDTAVGVNISGDVTYMVTKTFGAGVLLRYAKSTANISVEGATQSADVKAGGFQFAAGVRARF
jgi:hypothetical protein